MQDNKIPIKFVNLAQTILLRGYFFKVSFYKIEPGFSKVFSLINF